MRRRRNAKRHRRRGLCFESGEVEVVLDNAPKMGDNEIIKLFIICAHISSSSSLFPLSLSSSSSSRDSQWQCSSASSTARYVFFSFFPFLSFFLFHSFLFFRCFVNTRQSRFQVCLWVCLCVSIFAHFFFLSFLKWRVVTSVKVALKSGCCSGKWRARSFTVSH